MKLKQSLHELVLVAIFPAFILAGCGKSSDNSKPNPLNKSDSSSPASNVNVPNDILAIATKVKEFKRQKDPEQANQAMRTLTNRWNPVGKSAIDVQTLLGTPDEKTSDLLSYRFDTGWSGHIWMFYLSDQTITNVQQVGLE